MGYIRKALNKLFIDNTENSETEGSISSTKVCLMLFALSSIFIFEVSGLQEEAVHGTTDIKPSSFISRLFNQKDNINFVENNKSCSEKYVTAVVTNHGSIDNVPLNLWTDDCKVKNPTYTKEAIEQYHSLQNQNQFRIKYVTTGKYQKIYSVSDYGPEGYKEITTTFNTFDIKNRCIYVDFEKVCNVPKLHSGIYRGSFILDQDNKIIKTNYLERTHK